MKLTPLKIRLVSKVNYALKDTNSCLNRSVCLRHSHFKLSTFDFARNALPACPFKGALLMQVHDRPQSAPVLALVGNSVSVNACKTMHLLHAWLFRGKRRVFREFLKGLLRGQLCASAGVIQVLCRCEFFTIIIARSRVRPVSDGR